MTTTFPFFTNSALATNLLTQAQAETPTAANGWALAAGIASAAAGSNVGPWGYGAGVTITSAASGTREYTFAGPAVMPASGVTVSYFIKRGTLDLVRLAIKDTTSGITYSTDSTYNGGRYRTSTVLNGATGGVVEGEWNNGWQRVTLTVCPGVATSCASGDTYSILVQPQGLSKTIDIWGVMLETNPSQTFNGTGTQTRFDVTSFGLRAGDIVHAYVGGVLTTAKTVSNVSRTGCRVEFATAPASGTSNVLIVKAPAVATPYISGLGRFDTEEGRQSLPVFRVQDEEDSTGLRQMFFQAGVSATGACALQGRASANSAWVTVASFDKNSTSNPSGTGLDGTYTYQVDPTSATNPSITWGEMRVVITSIDSSDVLNAVLVA